MQSRECVAAQAVVYVQLCCVWVQALVVSGRHTFESCKTAQLRLCCARTSNPELEESFTVEGLAYCLLVPGDNLAP